MLTRLFGSRLRICQDSEWPTYVGNGWPRNLLDADLTDRLHRKQGRSIARWTLYQSARRAAVFVKRHYEHSFAKSLFRASDAMCEWNNLKQASRLGIPVPRPMAVAQWSEWPRRLQSALVLEELPDMIALHEAIPHAAKTLAASSFERWKGGLIAELVRLTKCMHDEGFFHRDLYLCHFFVASTDIESPVSDWRGRIVVIDFHRLTRLRLLPTLGRAKDLAQLLFSSHLPGITPRDRLRFWRLYCGSRSHPILRRLIEWKTRRYAQHNRKGGA